VICETVRWPGSKTVCEYGHNAAHAGMEQSKRARRRKPETAKANLEPPRKEPVLDVKPGATCRRKRRIITCVSRVPSHSGSRLSGISGCQGTYTPESSNMLDTQAGAPRHRAERGCGLDSAVRWAIGSPCGRHTAPPGRSQPQQKAHARKNP